MPFKPTTLHRRACKLLGADPDKIRLVGPTEWKALTGKGVSDRLGKAHLSLHMIYLRRGIDYDTAIHEVLHVLFPSRPHWWIYAAAYALAEHRPSVCSESWTKIVRLAHAAARRKGLA